MLKLYLLIITHYFDCIQYLSIFKFLVKKTIKYIILNSCNLSVNKNIIKNLHLNTPNFKINLINYHLNLSPFTSLFR